MLLYKDGIRINKKRLKVSSKNGYSDILYVWMNPHWITTRTKPSRFLYTYTRNRFAFKLISCPPHPRHPYPPLNRLVGLPNPIPDRAPNSARSQEGCSVISAHNVLYIYYRVELLLQSLLGSPNPHLIKDLPSSIHRNTIYMRHIAHILFRRGEMARGANCICRAEPAMVRFGS